MNKLLSLFAVVWLTAGAQALPSEPSLPDAGELRIALNKLAVLGSVLYVAAHPDDENTAALAYLSKGRFLRTAYLSLTRGDGGQNLIGPEQGAEIGILRTQELLSARRIDGAEQYFTRAVDFGYSKTAEETLQIWNGEEVLSDMVRVIRFFRPDIVITRFPVSGSSGHGHHTAGGRLVLEAFEAASDPTRFPEQLDTLQPWAPERLLLNTWRRSGDPGTPVVTADAGEYSPLLGTSFTELAALSRSMHKSQGFGSSGRRGARLESFQHVAGSPARSDLFDGIDTTWNRVRGGGPIAGQLEGVLETFDPEHPSLSVPALLDILKNVRRLDRTSWTETKIAELQQVIKACAGLWLDATADDFAAAPGDDIRIRITAVNRSDVPLIIRKIGLPGLAPDVPWETPLSNNSEEAMERTVRIPDDYPLTQPYWLKDPPTMGLFSVENREDLHRPESPPAVTVRISLTAGGQVLEYDVSLMYRWTDRAEGELWRPFEVRPKVTLNPEPKILLCPDSKPKRVTVIVRTHSSEAQGRVRLKGPEGWLVEPAELSFDLNGKYEEIPLAFTVTPPARSSEGEIFAEAVVSDRTHNRSLVEIAYPHIKRQVYFPISRIRAVRLDIEHAGTRVAYIMGAGDEVPEALRSVGYEVTELTDEDLEKGDLSRFDAVITGIRAYNTREGLTHSQARLLEYVERGGTLIVQYNVSRGLVTEHIGPFPLILGRGRVTVESAPVTLAQPDHPLLRWPNPITSRDFEGWIQERGLYFASQWDERYDSVLSLADPGEDKQGGGLLYARFGRGVFIYTGLSWFRQLPAGVPGAFRLFANLVSAGKAHAP